jgi:ABC-2 type transport system permease protein
MPAATLTPAATPSPRSLAHQVARSWRTARITPLGEVLSPPRLAATAVRTCLQITLVVFLWRGLYSHTSSQAGLDRGQAVSFAVLAVLATRLRGLDRSGGRDTVFEHVYYGTIVYWFLRPLPPRRYYALRALGDQAYGFAWFLAGYLACRGAGVLDPPASGGAAAACLASLLLGQAVLHQLTLLTDLLCFWTVQNGTTIQMIQFAQNLLSGAYAPLWYFPGWFIALGTFLPFQSTLNTPLSLYVGRIPLSSVPGELAFQAAWAFSLGLLTRLLWRRAALRVTSQGG